MEKFNPTSEMIQSAKSVFMTMAMVETIKPIVKGYVREILAKHQFHIAQEWIDKGDEDRIILDPNQSYLLGDNDFAVYLAETNEAREKAGLKVDNPEFCPLLVAEDLQSRAENVLIDTMESITNFNQKEIALYGENRKKFLDLTLRLLAPFIKNN